MRRESRSRAHRTSLTCKAGAKKCMLYASCATFSTNFTPSYGSVYVSPVTNWKLFFLKPVAGSLRKLSVVTKLTASRL